MKANSLVNNFGKVQGWNNVTTNLFGRDVVGIQELSYKDKVGKKNVQGAGRMPIGRTEENYEAEASITILKEELDAMKLTLPTGKRIQDIEMSDIVVQYALKSGKIVKDIIRGAEFTDQEITLKQGDGVIWVKLPLIITQVDWNVL